MCIKIILKEEISPKQVWLFTQEFGDLANPKNLTKFDYIKWVPQLVEVLLSYP